MPYFNILSLDEATEQGVKIKDDLCQRLTQYFSSSINAPMAEYYENNNCMPTDMDDYFLTQIMPYERPNFAISINGQETSYIVFDEETRNIKVYLVSPQRTKIIPLTLDFKYASDPNTEVPSYYIESIERIECEGAITKEAFDKFFDGMDIFIPCLSGGDIDSDSEYFEKNGIHIYESLTEKINEVVKTVNENESTYTGYISEPVGDMYIDMNGSYYEVTARLDNREGEDGALRIFADYGSRRIVLTVMEGKLTHFNYGPVLIKS